MRALVLIAVAGCATSRPPIVRGEQPSWSRLPAPHRVPVDTPLPALHEPADLRALVGRRDARGPIAAALDWARAVGWRGDRGASPPSEVVSPGDLLVFDRVEGQPADLLGVAVSRDARGVTEFVYVGGGAIRRGFVDARRPSVRRDAAGDIVNTFLRSGDRWPPSGTHYLAGELLAHVIHLR